MLERFTHQARQAVTQARQEAIDLGHPRIGTGHLLLGLLAGADDPGYPALREADLTHDRVRSEVRRRTGARRGGLTEADAQALNAIGIDLAAVLTRIEESFGADATAPPAAPPRRGLLRRGSADRHRTGGSSKLSAHGRKALELSLREAIRLKDRHIGTEHLLLGLIRHESGQAAKIIADAGVDLPDLRRQVEDTLRDKST